jgi:DNA-binding NtrC family response regulator
METSHSRRPPAVLVVEDEEFIRLDAVDIVTDAGFRAYEAANADEAMRLLEEHGDIRVLFTDVNMPGSIDGLRLAHDVHDRWPPVRIIITSGQMKIHEADMPTKSVFICKPYRALQVAGKLREMVAASHGG